MGFECFHLQREENWSSSEVTSKAHLPSSCPFALLSLTVFSVDVPLCGVRVATPFLSFTCSLYPTEGNGVASGELAFLAKRPFSGGLWQISCCVFLVLSRQCSLWHQPLATAEPSRRWAWWSTWSSGRGRRPRARVELSGEAARSGLLGGQPAPLPGKCASWSPGVSREMWELPEVILAFCHIWFCWHKVLYFYEIFWRNRVDQGLINF